MGIGLLERIWIIGGALGDPDYDEATVGIQALQFRRGHLDVFFLNQPYGGTVETALVTFSQTIFGVTVFALKVVPIACAAAAAVLVWRCALRLGYGPWAQLCAVTVAWCGFAPNVFYSTKERGFYGVALVLAALVVLLVLRLDQAVTRNDLLWLGLCGGLGWWQTPLSLLVFVPAVAWLVVRRPQVVTRAGWAVGAAVVGALPWLIWNAANGWESLRQEDVLGASWWDRERQFLTQLRLVVGIQTPFTDARNLLPGRWTGAVIVALVIAAATVATRHRAPGLLAVLTVGYGALYALNSLAIVTGFDPRYTYLLLPAVALSVAALVPDRPEARSGDARPATAALAASTLVIAVTVWGLVGIQQVAVGPTHYWFLSSPRLDEVAQLLEERGSGPIMTDSPGMQIAYYTEGRIEAGSFAVTRLPSYDRAARRAPRSTYVLTEDEFGNATRLQRHLDSHHIGYRREVIGRWNVFFIHQRVLPEDARLLYVFGGVVQAPA